MPTGSSWVLLQNNFAKRNVTCDGTEKKGELQGVMVTFKVDLRWESTFTVG